MKIQQHSNQKSGSGVACIMLTLFPVQKEEGLQSQEALLPWSQAEMIFVPKVQEQLEE